MPSITSLATSSTVLIESDWNLKQELKQKRKLLVFVLIESDWNLKDIKKNKYNNVTIVLIESDWNLKHTQYTN